VLRDVVSGRSREHGHLGLLLGEELGRPDAPEDDAETEAFARDIDTGTAGAVANGGADSVGSSS